MREAQQMQLQESTEKKAEEDRGKEEVRMKKQTTKKKTKKGCGIIRKAGSVDKEAEAQYESCRRAR